MPCRLVNSPLSRPLVPVTSIRHQDALALCMCQNNFQNSLTRQRKQIFFVSQKTEYSAQSDAQIQLCALYKNTTTQSAVFISNSRTSQLFTHQLCISAHPLLDSPFSWWCCTCWRACAQPSVEHDPLLHLETSLFSSHRLVTGAHRKV